MKYRIIIFALIGLLVLVSVLAFVFGRKNNVTEVATINFWGIDAPEAWSAIISAYQTANPGVTINYQQKNSATYEKDFLNALASGAGPDVLAIKNTWLNKHLNKLSPAPASLMGLQTFKDTFMDVASQDLARAGQIYALPFSVDTLGLYYSKALYNNSGIVDPPKTWDKFNDVVKLLSQKDKDGNIIRSGAALGTAENVNHASDILNLLMLQTGTVMTKDNQASFDKSIQQNGKTFNPGTTALDFYTSFANSVKPVYAWNARMPNSLTAFTTGKTAMYLGYASDLTQIRNSGTNFGVVPVPQIKNSNQDATYLDVNFASYQAGAVTQTSANKDAAWNFLVFAVSKNAAGTYLNATHLPPARKDLIAFTAPDAALNVFAKQALSASTWQQPDDVEVKKIFERMISAVALGQSTSAEAIKEGAVEVTNLLK